MRQVIHYVTVSPRNDTGSEEVADVEGERSHELSFGGVQNIPHDGSMVLVYMPTFGVYGW